MKNIIEFVNNVSDNIAI